MARSTFKLTDAFEISRESDATRDRYGRDHWGAVQSVLFAGGGIRGGNVVGKSDARGAYPDEQPVKPENFAATIYDALGIPATAA
ncbi:DUF1501 domain-containing protein [Stieleria varia]|uniref:DUF1501 domain-containing protein n=1 Tax=Stieleria varia TaxID=2528005 RepID=A0A5C6BA08_9BACT|nr:DUF1501 domain-containing protein [Stieleria varia]TWU08096.1 hypothetical protein Pla52n_06770 [Stieleria varia]